MTPSPNAQTPESESQPAERQPAGRSSGERPVSVARDSLLNLLGTGLPLILALFTIPPVVRGLGPERFGVLGLVWVVLGYFNLLDLGLGRAATKYGADAIAHGDMAALRGVARTAAAVQLATGLAGGLVTAAFAPMLAHRVFDATPAVAAEAAACFLALAAAAPVIALTNTFRGLLEAGRRFDVVNAIRAPVSSSNFLLPLLALAGWSLASVVVAMVGVRVVALVAYGGACVRIWPELRDVTRRGTAPRGMIRFGGWMTVSALVSPLLVYADRFVIGAIIGMAAVGYYTAPHEIVMRLEVLPASIVAALFPAFASDLARSGTSAALAARSVRSLLLMLGPAAVALAILAPDVLQLWLGAEHARAGGTVLRLLALGMLFNAMAYVPIALIQAAGRADLPAKFHIIELGIHVIVLTALTACWGLPGAAAAWLLRMVLDAVLLNAAARRLGLMTGAALRVARSAQALAWLTAFTASAGIGAILGQTPGARVVIVVLIGIAWTPLAIAHVLPADERAQLAGVFGRRTRHG